MKGKIKFNAKEGCIVNESEAINCLKNVLKEEKKKLGEINYIILSDKELLRINKKFLKHNYYTDVITFSNNNKSYIYGDIYISIERVKLNASKYKVNFEEELKRVIVHGLLHLIGYDDKNNNLKSLMKEKEDFYLK